MIQEPIHRLGTILPLAKMARKKTIRGEMITKHGEDHSGFNALGIIDLNREGKELLVRSHTPSSASDTGIKGEICWDSSYIYVCVDTDTWVRVGISW